MRQNSARSLAVAYSPGPALFDFFKADMAATSESTTATQKKFLELATDEDSRKRAQAVVDVRQVWLAVREEANALKAAGELEVERERGFQIGKGLGADRNAVEALSGQRIKFRLRDHGRGSFHQMPLV